MKQGYVGMLPQRGQLAIIISFLFTVIIGTSYAADVQITTPPGGNFVVKNNAGTTTLLKVDGIGPVTVPNLSSAPTYTTGVCFGIGGVLGQCASIAGPAGPTGPAGTNGIDGNTLLYGSGAPASGTGVNGNFYIDTAANYIYGPKAAGIWPAGVSIVGPTGATGATGATGGGLSQYAYIYNTTAQVVAVEADVPFDSNGIITSGITHTIGSAAIQIVNSGTYEISWVLSVAESNQFALAVNGTPVASSIYGSGAGTQQNSGQMILALLAGNTIAIRNHSSAAAVTFATVIGGTQANVNASILIRKLN